MSLTMRGIIRNRFDIHVEHVDTGKIEKFVAHNIVLNQIYNRLCNGQVFFDHTSHIHYGSGTGTLGPTRTTLFSRQGSKASAASSIIWSNPGARCIRSIVLGTTEANGITITEVGVGFSSSDTSMVTHAFLKDSEGATISITKNNTMVVTIFATQFASLVDSLDGKAVAVRIPDAQASPMAILLGFGGSWGALTLGTGGYDLPRVSGQHGSLLGNVSYAKSLSGTADVGNKRVNFSGTLLEGEGNSPGNWSEVLFNGFSIQLPLGTSMPKHAFTGVSVGTGDGTTRAFMLPVQNLDLDTIVVKVDGTTVDPIDYVKERHPVKGEGVAYSRDFNYGSVDVGGFGGLSSASAGCFVHLGGLEDKYFIAYTIDDKLMYTPLQHSQFGANAFTLLDTPVFGANQVHMTNNNMQNIGDYLLIRAEGTSRFAWYKIAEVAGEITLTKLDLPAGFPTAGTVRFDAHKDGYVVVTSTTGPFFQLYKINTTTDELDTLTNPGTLLSGGVVPLWTAEGDHLFIINPDSSIAKYNWDSVAEELKDFANLSSSAFNATSSVNDDGTLLYRGGNKDFVRFNPGTNAFGSTVTLPVLYEYGNVSSCVIQKMDHGFNRIAGYYSSFSGIAWRYTLCCGNIAPDGTVTVERDNAAETNHNSGTAFFNFALGRKIGTYFLRLRNASTGVDWASVLRWWHQPLRRVWVVFDTAPALNEAITSDFEVLGIRKTTGFTVAFNASLQFGEPVE